jgi:hypothetical protein
MSHTIEKQAKISHRFRGKVPTPYRASKLLDTTGFFKRVVYYALTYILMARA